LTLIILLTHSVISHSGSVPSMDASRSAFSFSLALAWVQFHFQPSNLDQKSARCSESAASIWGGEEWTRGVCVRVCEEGTATERDSEGEGALFRSPFLSHLSYLGGRGGGADGGGREDGKGGELHGDG
jgi:hypothetical protein